VEELFPLLFSSRDVNKNIKVQAPNHSVWSGYRQELWWLLLHRGLGPLDSTKLNKVHAESVAAGTATPGLPGQALQLPGKLPPPAPSDHSGSEDMGGACRTQTKTR